MRDAPPRATRPSRTRRAAQNLALLLATLVLGLGLLEIATRLFTNMPPELGRRDAVLGKTYRPGFRGKVYVEESRRKVFLRFNRDGFRGEDLPQEPPPGSRRVAVLGDSFVASVACDEDDTCVRRLQGQLDESHPQVRWDVMNFGVSGSSTGQELVLYRELVSRYHPDVVLCAYYVGNDFTDNSTRFSTNPRIYFDLDDHGNLVQLPFSAARRRLSAWLNAHSRFYVWQKRANDLLVAHGKGDTRVYRTRTNGDLEHVWRLNARLIRELRDEVEGRGSRFVLVLFPSAPQVYPDVWRRLVEDAGGEAAHLDPDYPDRRLRSVCSESGIPIVTMTREFRDAARARSAEDTPADDLLFFGGVGHFTPQGNRLAARVIHDFLARKGILDSILPSAGTSRSPGQEPSDRLPASGDQGA